ncbi:MAG: hypothetical protein J6A59_12365 [Lachnospiraceae bacterium]|nr:hypothetical protein [Lachnospiraceae bacterium]
MFRTRSYRRDVRNKTIARKKRICRAIYGGSPHRLYETPEPGYWYKVDGKYAKGKIHCSCKMCKYSKHYGLPTVRDLREREIERDALKDF